MYKLITIIILFSTSYSISLAQEKNYSKDENGVNVHKILTEKDCIDITNFMDSIILNLVNIYGNEYNYVYELTIAYNVSRVSRRERAVWRRNIKLLESKTESKFENVRLNKLSLKNDKNDFILRISIRMLSNEKITGE